ncbi:LLM class flavin-dependent oxidoreductase [Nocardia cyriacigeorgica]|uniref:LLM class flavin-dependent oxidoreductase n=1 Tax=Nocardia cyriacigeorgica TaxID=135487 RepID=A0A6P1D7V0_9NOCA|nr:LLM class flavin-dependent oxidoreductase [Nocardia cyriacigeorgica]NEW45689.1 LLM class flavin-dependent oxidoreductase [Nocardia cyriacigeorgica]NEW55404.1 LLM class flavin-dependent oxidoreductase [Nocardia cyriacigeorgica]
MRVNLLCMFTGKSAVDDVQVYRDELSLAVDAEAMGFDRVMAVEHHFTDYAFCPDNAQFLSYVAAKTSKIELFPAAFILPWNDPVRVAEKVVMLDHLSGGRAVLGLGRGLARNEFTAFRQNLSESRDRFDESAAMVLDALDTGFIEGDGPHYEQPRVEIRPRPFKSFKGRSYMVGTSPASMDVAARLGLGAMKFANAPWSSVVEEVDGYRDAFHAYHGVAAPPLITGDVMVCHRDDKRGEELARVHHRNYFVSVMSHYELLSDHFKETLGSYAHYASMADAMRGTTEEALFEGYLGANLWGDPSRILDQLALRRELLGDFELSVAVNFGDIDIEEARNSMRLFAEHVLPELKSWAPEGVELKESTHV